MNDILLGLVVEKAGGDYAAFIQKNILDLLALKDTGLDSSRRLLEDRATGYANAYALADPIDIDVMGAAGALYSTVGDLYRLEEGLASGAILSDTTAAQMTAPTPASTTSTAGQLIMDMAGFGRISRVTTA